MLKLLSVDSVLYENKGMLDKNKGKTVGLKKQ